MKSWVFIRFLYSERESREGESSAAGFVDLVGGRWSSPVMVSVFPVKAGQLLREEGELRFEERHGVQ